MGLFSRGKSGGMMNVIRCDEQEYIIWKWRPEGQDANTTTRENSIRWGSSLRVKDGEAAVFVYKKKNGLSQDFIEGPFDDILKTSNLPILANLVGLAYGGESPFQAEVYFINIAGVNQIKFAVPYFDIFDPRFPDHGVPMAIRGTLTFCVVDYRNFIKLHRLVDFNYEQFMKQIKDAVSKYVKGIVMNIPQEMGIPVVQLERQILNINDRIIQYLKPRLETEFGIQMKNLDIATLDIDKESPYYEELRKLTADITAKTINAQAEVNIKNMTEMQAINSENMEEAMRIQREELQRSQRLHTETSFIGAHTVNLQADVLKTGAQSLGQMGNMDLGSGGDGGNGGGGMNPAGMMTGMMMGGAMGQQMAGMMNAMGGQMQQAVNTPPPVPTAKFFVVINDAQAGPFDMNQLMQMVNDLRINKDTLVWKQGMETWVAAGDVAELEKLFNAPAMGMTPPPIP